MKRFAFLRSTLCVAALTYAFLTAAASAQLVVNGGFETGDFTGWTVVDPSDFTLVGTNPAFSNTGTDHADLGATGLLGSLSQAITTTPGGTYSLSFALANDGNVPPNEFDVYWNGVQISSITDAASFAYTIYSFNNLVATGSSTGLEFRYRNDEDFFRLDDVTVNVVPELSTTSSVVLGFGCLGAFCYRRRKVSRSVSA
ncbi:MAG: hypothetical protein ACXWG7_08540 [Chthoniobacterales bacterium]